MGAYVRDVMHGLLHDGEIPLGSGAQCRFTDQHRFDIEGHGRQGIVNVVGDAASHLTQGLQPFLLSGMDGGTSSSVAWFRWYRTRCMKPRTPCSGVG